MKDIIKLLKDISFFSLLGEKEIESIYKISKRREYEAGQIVFEEGESGEECFLVLNGSVEVWKNYNSPNKDLLAVLGRRKMFGEMALIDNLPRSATVITTVSTSLLAITGNRFNRIISENNLIALSIMRMISGVIRDANDNYVERLRARNKELEKAHAQMKLEIEDRKRAQKALGKAKEEAEIANKVKSEFLSNVSHEIRTPMNGVIGFVDILLETDLDENQMDYAQTIKRSGESLLSLLNDILDFSKIEAGELIFEQIDFNPELLAFDICELIRPRIETKKIEMLCHIDEEIPDFISGDPGRFRQVLMNLMGNSSKFTESGEIELKLVLEDEDDDKIKLHATVRDTGIGIPFSKLENIFLPFQQSNGSTTRKYGGTGLGLSVCRQIVNLMEGDIWAESLLDSEKKTDNESFIGPGSTFHLTAWFGKSLDKRRKELNPKNFVGDRILLVDDNETSRMNLSFVLESLGASIKTIDHGKKVISELKRAEDAGQPYKTCICDIQMPDMNGYEVIKEIRKSKNQFKDLPLIALSSFRGKDVSDSRETGFNGFLTKPVQKDKLFRLMKKILDKGGGLATVQSEMNEQTDHPGTTPDKVADGDVKKARILLADDNPVNQKLVLVMLKKAGYDVEVAEDGKEAVDKYLGSPQRFDLIIMDIQMPEMDGIQATRAIRALEQDNVLFKGIKDKCKRSEVNSKRRRIPIVAMTAYAMKGDREASLEVGMDDYITKPIKKEVVFDVLKKWLPKEKK